MKLAPELGCEPAPKARGSSWRRLFAALLLLAAALVHSGCGELADYARLIEANRLHDRGDYQAAVDAYLKVSPSAFPSTLDYDLANAYARLGAYERSAELYAAAVQKGDRALAADSRFNQGLADFERGRFHESWLAFRSALRGAEPSGAFARAARRNLELAWRAWQRRGPGGTLSPSPRGSTEGEERELRLLQRLETGHWNPGKTAPDPSGALDY